MSDYWVYILLCENQTFYTGYTNNLDKRYQSHVAGNGGCKYTRAFKPLGIAQCWQVNSKSLAMQVEHSIKSLPRTEKLALIKNPQLLCEADSRINCYHHPHLLYNNPKQK